MSWALHVGDCLDVMRAMPAGSVDHVICDPPYEAQAHTQKRRVKRSGAGVTKNELLDFAPITEAQRAAVGLELGRLTRRWVIVFCQIEAAMMWRESLRLGGLRYMRTCIWDKPDGCPQLTGDRPGMGYETMVVAHTRGRSRWNGGGTRGVFTHSARWSGGMAHAHPTEKPLTLMTELVRLFSDESETVLDPFAGSGTTGVAALRLGRSFIGIEKDPKYAEIARQRLAAEDRGLTLQAARQGQTSIFDVIPGGVRCR